MRRTLPRVAQGDSTTIFLPTSPHLPVRVRLAIDALAQKLPGPIK
ncbi:MULTISPECIES: hypothetical protein [unclassified Corallococcus]|nr:MULTISPECIES: hypothetical protein [unclassified Corallococcus]WAS83623.1 hypothetical protein O0N60_30460 [Corallococcus sp. NCRR]